MYKDGNGIDDSMYAMPIRQIRRATVSMALPDHVNVRFTTIESTQVVVKTLAKITRGTMNTSLTGFTNISQTATEINSMRTAMVVTTVKATTNALNNYIKCTTSPFYSNR